MSSSSDSGVPSFSLTTPRYDQSTYIGRFKHFLSITRPQGLFLTESKLDAAIAKLNAYQANGNKVPDGVTDAEMWDARLTKQVMVHPDTGEIIPYPFRMSFFAPANVPIAVGMVLFGQSLANQVYNGSVNFANRNATVEVSDAEAATSLAAASAIACGMAFVMGKGAKRIAANPKYSPTVKSAVNRLVPLTAVAAAGAFNALAMRYKEGLDGIDVYDEHGTVYGKSPAAGKLGLGHVALTRMVLPIPILLLPPYLMDALKKHPGIAKAVQRSPLGVGFAMELSVIVTCILFALPGAIALSPQEMTVDAQWLEPKYHKLTSPVTGEPVKTLIYNKGM